MMLCSIMLGVLSSVLIILLMMVLVWCMVFFGKVVWIVLKISSGKCIWFFKFLLYLFLR